MKLRSGTVVWQTVQHLSSSPDTFHWVSSGSTDLHMESQIIFESAEWTVYRLLTQSFSFHISFSYHIMLSFFPSTLTVPLIGFVMMILTNFFFHLITSFTQACDGGGIFPGGRLWRFLKVFVVELFPLVVHWGSAIPVELKNSSFIMGYFHKRFSFAFNIKGYAFNIIRSFRLLRKKC